MSYEIRPVGLKVRFSEWVSSWFTPVNLGCTGCGSSVAALALLLWIYHVAQVPQGWGARLLAFAAASGAIYCVTSFALYQSRKRRRNRSEAEKATTEAAAILQGVKEHSAYLSFKAQAAKRSLASAAFEFEEKAYAPFWDAIERVASELGECHTSSLWLAASAGRYDTLLLEKDHNFPDYFDGIESLPDCRPLLEEFYQLVRQGQRDFSFANIWEHRQTRKVLIAGFSTLGEAIRQLETTVARSLAELKSAVEARTLIPTPAGSPAKVALKFFIPIA